MSDPYDRDFHVWTAEQAALLRAGDLGGADIARIAEELDCLGRAEKRELVSRLTVLFLHLLKWDHQPSHRGNSWRLSIENARDEIAEHLADNPSLKAHLPETIATAYRRASRQASIETGLSLSTFSDACPWTFDRAMRDPLT